MQTSLQRSTFVKFVVFAVVCIYVSFYLCNRYSLQSFIDQRSSIANTLHAKVQQFLQLPEDWFIAPPAFDVKIYNISAPVNDTTMDCSPIIKLNPPYRICIHDPKIDRFISGDIKHAGGWEADKSRYIAEKLKEVPNLQATLLDAGANIGVHSIYAAVLGAQVVAVEPSPENLPHFAKAAQINNVTHRITLLPYALSNTRRTVQMSKEQGYNVGSTYIAGNNTNNKPLFNVEALLLDDLIPLIKTKIVIVKMDIQYHECYVVASGLKFLDKLNVRYFIMEYLKVRKGQEACRQNMHDVFLARNYTPYFLSPSKGKRVVLGKDNPVDLVWVKGDHM